MDVNEELKFFVKIQNKDFFWGGGGVRGGGGPWGVGVGLPAGWWVRVDVSEELKFL